MPQITTSSSATAVNYIHGVGADLYNENNNSNVERKTIGFPVLTQQLPMLASNCPGWVCFAEKSQPQALPYISSTKSPQQILGNIIHYIYQKRNSINIKPYVVSIQPCFDKKLEASRNVCFCPIFPTKFNVIFRISYTMKVKKYIMK